MQEHPVTECIIKEVEGYVKADMKDNDPSHDFHHVQRVVKLAFHLAEKEGIPANSMGVIHLSALLHDVADRKYCNNAAEKYAEVRTLLEKHQLEASVVDDILFIIDNISYSKEISNSGVKHSIREELQKLLEVVKDADRLDAIGAFGVARVFCYSGARNIDFLTALSHFDEKLLLLIDRMCTSTGKEIAVARHNYLKNFKLQFLAELALEG